MAPSKFFIQDDMATVAAHHESYAKLWETKWRKPVCCVPLVMLLSQ